MCCGSKVSFPTITTFSFNTITSRFYALWFYAQFDYYNSMCFGSTVCWTTITPWFYVLWFYAQFDYYNSMLINSGDEDGNFAPLGGDFPLEENEHFNQLLVNVQQSDIQVPTNVYNRGLTPQIPYGPPRPP